jgi:hypothetical protein
MLKSPLLRLSTLALMIGAGQAGAYELYADDDSHLNATLEAVFGVFHSQENYALSGRLDEGSSSWREGYIKYGLSWRPDVWGAMARAYGAFEPAQLRHVGRRRSGRQQPDGTERTTKIEDAYLGWRSSDLFPALGKDGVDLSVRTPEHQGRPTGS